MCVDATYGVDKVCYVKKKTLYDTGVPTESGNGGVCRYRDASTLSVLMAIGVDSK